MTQIGVAMQQADVIMQQNSYCIRARAIRHNIGTRPRACGPRARCQYLTYSPCAHAITITNLPDLQTKYVYELFLSNLYIKNWLFIAIFLSLGLALRLVAK